MIDEQGRNAVTGIIEGAGGDVDIPQRECRRVQVDAADFYAIGFEDDLIPNHRSFAVETGDIKADTHCGGGVIGERHHTERDRCSRCDGVKKLTLDGADS